MLKRFVRVFGGDPDKRTIEKFTHVVNQINDLEATFELLDDSDLIDKTNQFRLRLALGETLDEILPEAYAIVREAAKRTIGQRHYDVQLIGGIALHEGIVTEMKTGEGKTLVATLPLYLNAISLNPDWVKQAKRIYGENAEDWIFDPIDEIPLGNGAHLITVNDYLARRDARWKAPIYNMLGLSVGVLQMAARTEHGKKAYLVDLQKTSPHEDQHQLSMVPRKLAYSADITYGTNNEYGFDYLRDNMAMQLEDRVQRGHFYAIIDEVDNVLIDEARTPLIISGPSHDDTEWYVRMSQVVKQLKAEDYEIDVRDRTITLTEIGETNVEKILGIALRDPERPEDVTPEQARLLGYLEQALRAQYLYKKNKEYLVQASKVVIVDDFTGRLMPGRRWSDGLHQAVEAKEGVKVQSENATYATITIQNYFRMYQKLAGMTGTAITEAEEFSKIYDLDVLAIPTNLDYLASGEDPHLLALQDQDEYGYKYTYYKRPENPSNKPEFWKRKDYPDIIYRTTEAKLRAIAIEILTYHVLGRPILVGTTSVELSDLVSRRLRAEPIRRLIQTLLIRKKWFEKSEKQEDGRRMPELAPLNLPLDKLRPAELRNIIREYDLAISLNPEDSANVDNILTILDISVKNKSRLESVLRGGIPHQVLNARKHTEESQIIADAGAFGGVSIATNMAGRGVDIKLGGDLAEEILSSVNRVLRRSGYDDPFEMTIEQRHKAILELNESDYGIYGAEIKYFLQHIENMEKVKELGGLHVIGSERHEARRIDNQLRGRSSRQGDPGSSRFYLSLDDDLMVRFGGQQMESILSRLNVDEALPIEHNLVSRIVEQSQTRVEGANFDVRKHLLEYDDVLNTQREKIYSQRNRIFLKDDLSEDVFDMLREEISRRVPQAYEDEEGPWKLLSWLDQIQPSTIMNGKIFPSFTLKLLFDDFLENYELESSDEVLSSLMDVASRAIQEEEEHLLFAINELLDRSYERLEDQINESLEVLDTFIEGLSLADETDTRDPQELLTELSNSVRLPLKLQPAELRELRRSPDDLIDILGSQVERLIMLLTISRILGAIARILKEPVPVSINDLDNMDWDTMAALVLESIDQIFDKRRERLLGENGTSGQIEKEFSTNLIKSGASALNQQDVLQYLMLMPQGRRAAFDKKTHRRVWVRTNRFTYIHSAARLLEGREPKEIADEILAHLEKAQISFRDLWGESELNRLGEMRPADLDKGIQDNLKSSLGPNNLSKIIQIPLAEIEDTFKNKIIHELGRHALTRLYRQLLLRVISELWVEYLTHMEALRVSIGLEAYAQRDPLVQYKNRAFEMFSNLLGDMRVSIVTRMFTFQPRDATSLQSSAEQSELPPQEPEEPSQDQKLAKKRKRRRRRR